MKNDQIILLLRKFNYWCDYSGLEKDKERVQKINRRNAYAVNKYTLGKMNDALKPLGLKIYSEEMEKTWDCQVYPADGDLAVLPDSQHRHWFFHSCIIPVVFTIYTLGWELSRFYDMFYFCATLASHLIADLHLSDDKKIGTYLIFKWKGDRMSVKNTDIWMNTSIIITVGISILSLVMVTIGRAG